MKIQTKKSKVTPKLQKLNEDAIATKNRILNFLDNNPQITEGVDYIRSSLAFADFSYILFGDEINIESLDRTKSLIGVHLYISNQHPQPLRKDGKKMFPVLQLDTTWLNFMCDKSLENCLLQLWWDGSKYEGFFRKIPLSDLSEKELIPLEISPDIKDDGLLWIPDDWVSSDSNNALQILECKPMGLTNPDIDTGTDWMREDNNSNTIDQDIWDDLEKFSMYSDGFSHEPKSTNKKIARIFGQFYAAQISANEAPYDGCLMSFGWGGGFGNIFYDTDKRTNKNTFVFYFDK